ncbi:MAG: AgmX/PglI C-terminal domain-containing protein [Polyangiales bacterium]
MRRPPPRREEGSPPEVIQRVVRASLPQFRQRCYEPALRSNRSLQGRVSVRFVIDLGGVVTLNSDGGSDLPNGDVVRCYVRAFSALRFPRPEGGMVTVTYPVMLSP